MTEGAIGSPGPEEGASISHELTERRSVPRVAEAPGLKEVSDRVRINSLREQIGFLMKDLPEDSPEASDAKHEMTRRLGMLLGAFDITTDPDERQALNDFAGDMRAAANDLFLVTRGDVLPASLDTLLVTDPNASEKAALYLPATEDFFVTARSEREAEMKAAGDVLLVRGESGTEERNIGRYLKTSEVKPKIELLAGDYKALVDLRNWVANTVQERGLPTSKNSAEWTEEDRRLQSKLDKIQQCEAYFAQTYGGDIAHHTAPTEVELNAFHRYLGELRDSVLSGAEADDAEMIAVVPGDAVGEWSNEQTTEIPAVPLDRTQVMPRVLLDQIVAQSAESSRSVRPVVGAAEELGVVAARGVRLVGRAAEAVGTGLAAFQAERLRRGAEEGYNTQLAQEIAELESSLGKLNEQRGLVERKLNGPLTDETMRPVLEAMIPDIDDDIGQLNAQLSNLRGSSEDGLSNAA